MDNADDVLVAPACGRLVSFSSGFENLHRVRKVVKGTRLVLAMWFTCSKDHQYREEEKAQSLD